MPTLIPGLRSPYDQVDDLVYFGRMVDKIRLHEAGKLPKDWLGQYGSENGFDGRCCRFLGIKHADLIEQVKKGGDDKALLAWAKAHGRNPSEEEIEVWNGFISKRGLRDDASARLREREKEGGFAPNSLLTFFDYIDADEGRSPRY